MNTSDPVLDVRDLVVEFSSEDGPLRAVDGVSFSVRRGEIVGLVGESGAGKTLTSEAILRLIRCPPGRLSGEVWFHGRDLLSMDESDLERIRGKEIAMIFQNPGASLNPVFRVGDQLFEAMRLHLSDPVGVLRERVTGILTRVGIPSAAARAREYPHQFSGGMAQRVMIGMGVSCVPALLIADEPTTALDVTIQAQVLALIRQLAREMGMAVLLVSHDLGIVSQMCHRVIVMYAGRIVEEADVATIFRAPAHPYTRGLIECLPRLEVRGAAEEVRGAAAGEPSEKNPNHPVGKAEPAPAGTAEPAVGVVARLGAIPGVMPGLGAIPAGCRFHPRCPIAEARCSETEPALRPLGDGHRAACLLAS